MNDPKVIKFGEWWDGESFTNDNPYHKESFAYWAWEGWQAGWKGASTVERLTDFERGYLQGKEDGMKRPVKTFSGNKPNYVIPPETFDAATVAGNTKLTDWDINKLITEYGLTVIDGDIYAFAWAVQHASRTKQP